MTGTDRLDELSHAENPARELLEKLGWTYVPREVLAAERDDEREVLLKERLRRALLRLNEWMTKSQANWVISELEHTEGSGITRNQRVHEDLIYGKPVSTPTASGRQSRIARFFDFEHPEGGLNEFVVTTQFRVRRGNERRDLEDDQRVVKPDLALFVNGIPLVVMEAKSPSLMDVWRTKAVRQLRRYQEAGPEWHGTGAPELFHTNLLCVANCGAAAAYATLGAPENAYVEWKSVLPYSETEVRQRFGVEPEGQAQLIVGLLAPATLLDILRDYVVYEPQGGKVVKKLPRYQQYRAVGAALERLLGGRKPDERPLRNPGVVARKTLTPTLSQREREQERPRLGGRGALGKGPEERGGVVWHTQGSGKSLTMLWLATKLRREPRLQNPTIVVVTDRRQLDRQISGTFERCGFPAPEQASSTRGLRRLLTSGGTRTVMTTIQKFEDALEAPSGRLDVLNASDNVVVMVDEAHRTQYGALGARMSRALPNAALIGFTGTPIDRGFGQSTMQRFGPLIDSYTIPQSVEDGATVPIYYEARLPELHIEGPETLDTLFEEMFDDLSEDEQARIRRRYANKETVAEAEKRIEMIALDISRHFKTKIKPNGFKAQVVAPSRAAALRYAERLKDFNLNAYPIITTSPNDGAEFAVARDLNQEQVTSAFVDPEGEPEILVVVDMLLTGFDAPVEQVLYLDRGLREHGLLQAIARVNRRFSHKADNVDTEKPHGLVVDYHGVSRDLEAALETFEWPDVKDTMEKLEEKPGPAIEAAAVQAESYFKGRDLDNEWDCVAVFAPDASSEGEFKADLFERFNADYREFGRLMDRYLPDPGAEPYVERLTRLTVIRTYVRAHFLRDTDLDWSAIGAKVKKLIDERIDAEVRELMRPVSILDQDFEAKIEQLPHDEARASLMEHAVRAQINERLGENPAFFTTLSEELDRIIRELRDRLIDAAEACRQMAKLRSQVLSEADIAAQYGLSPVAFAVCELLAAGDGNETAGIARATEREVYRTAPDAEVAAVAQDVESAIERHRDVIDWTSNLEVQREMRRDIKRELRETGEYTEERLDELAHQIVEAARQRAGR